MPSYSNPMAKSGALMRTVAIAALISAPALGGMLNSAYADNGVAAPLVFAQAAAPKIPGATPKTAAAAGVIDAKGEETVDQRIAALHTALKITPAQETKWQAVGQAMRENATAMDKLITDSKAKAAQSMTAVNDLYMYQKFAQAHVDGLKNLIDDFKDLYAVMPDSQKKLADEVFKSSGAPATPSNG